MGEGSAGYRNVRVMKHVESYVFVLVFETISFNGSAVSVFRSGMYVHFLTVYSEMRGFASWVLFDRALYRMVGYAEREEKLECGMII